MFVNFEFGSLAGYGRNISGEGKKEYCIAGLREDCGRSEEGAESGRDGMMSVVVLEMIQTLVLIGIGTVNIATYCQRERGTKLIS